MLILVAVSVKILIDSNIIGNAQSAAEQTKTAYEKEGQMGKITVNGKEYASVQDYVDNKEWKDPALNPSGTIPEGGRYYVAATTSVRNSYYAGSIATLTAGQEFPATVSAGDAYVFGDYEYRYGRETYPYYSDYPAGSQEGWSVYALEWSKVEYGPILESINGINITSMDRCFCDGYGNSCSNMVTAPVIPQTVTNLHESFGRCYSLTVAPQIPSGVTNVTNAFYHCTGLTVAPVIPDGVADLYGVFSGCTSLKGTIEINANPSWCAECFYECAQDAEHAITITGSASAETKAALKATGYNSGANISI